MISNRTAIDPVPEAIHSTSTDTFCAELVDWLNRNLVPPGTTVGPDTPLFAGGLINSIRILELIAWTERAAGLTIPDRMIRMDNFGTARRIAQTFGGSGGLRNPDRPNPIGRKETRNVAG